MLEEGIGQRPQLAREFHRKGLRPIALGDKLVNPSTQGSLHHWLLSHHSPPLMGLLACSYDRSCADVSETDSLAFYPGEVW